MQVSFCTDQFEEMADFYKNKLRAKEKVTVRRKK